MRMNKFSTIVSLCCMVRPVPKGIDLPKTKHASIEDMALVHIQTFVVQ